MQDDNDNIVDEDRSVDIKNEEEENLTPAEEGEQSVSGSAPSTTSDDDVAKMVEDVIGNEPEPGKPFSIADEVAKDEKAKHDIPPDEANLEGSKEDKDPFSDE